MDYANMVMQHCPAAIHRSVADADRGMGKTEQMLLFSAITSTALDATCALGVVGELARKTSPERSSAFKDTFLSLASRYRRDLQALDSAVYSELRRNIRDALTRILDDIQQSSLRAGMLDVLSGYGINLLDDISVRVDYESLTNPAFLADWQFNEYAACMGDEEAPARLARILERSDASVLRQLFTELLGEVRREAACLDEKTLHDLVRPYLEDDRVTPEIEGDGPPVSTYARELVNELSKAR